MLELHVLASGSKGNAAVVRDGRTGRSVLIDCGICRRDFFDRCSTLGIDPCSIEDVLVTHAHGDHTSGLGVVLRGLSKQGCLPAVRTHPGVCAQSKALTDLDGVVAFEPIVYMQPLRAAGMTIVAFPTSHDVAESMGFRIETDDDALGYVTDSGFLASQTLEALSGVRILAIESNHDVAMLKEGPYPYVLQQRILGDSGHLSNIQCRDGVEALLHPGLEQIVAMHISEHNNTFSLPVKTLQELLDERGHAAKVQAALSRTPMSVI